MNDKEEHLGVNRTARGTERVGGVMNRNKAILTLKIIERNATTVYNSNTEGYNQQELSGEKEHKMKNMCILILRLLHSEAKYL